MVPSTFTSLHSDPASRAYYQHKRNPRQSTLSQAIPTRAHHRIPTLHTMIRNNILYNPQPDTKPPTAARHTT